MIPGTGCEGNYAKMHMLAGPACVCSDETSMLLADVGKHFMNPEAREYVEIRLSVLTTYGPSLTDSLLAGFP